MTLNSSIVVLIMSLNLSGAKKDMIIVSLAAIWATMVDFPSVVIPGLLRGSTSVSEQLDMKVVTSACNGLQP